MSKSKTVSFVSLSDIYNHIGFTEYEAEVIGDCGFSNVSFGDAGHTLVGNNFALACITEGYDAYLRVMNDEENLDQPSRNIPDELLNDELIAKRFWEVVGQNDYVDLEG